MPGPVARPLDDVDFMDDTRIYIETPRLLLREWKRSDLPVFVGMNRDPFVMEFFPKRLTEKESLEFADRIRGEFGRFGYGLYAVETKDEGAFIGYTGFHRFAFDADFAPGVEIGWRLRPQYWNRGYATEAAGACLTYAGNRLPFTEVYAFTSLANKRSERVMQKIGMERVKEFPHPCLPDGHPLQAHVLYRIGLTVGSDV